MLARASTSALLASQAALAGIVVALSLVSSASACVRGDRSTTPQGQGEVSIACVIPPRVEQFSSFWIEFHVHNGTSTAVHVETANGVNVHVRSGDDWQELNVLNTDGTLRDARPSGELRGSMDEAPLGIAANETVIVAREYRDPYGITIEGDFRLRGGGWIVESKPGHPVPKRTSIASPWVTYSVVKSPAGAALSESRRDAGPLWRAYNLVMRWHVDWGDLCFPNLGKARAIGDSLSPGDPVMEAVTTLDAADIPPVVRMRARMLKCKVAAERALNVSAEGKALAFGAIARDLEALSGLAESVNNNWLAEVHLARCLCYEQGGLSVQLAGAKAALAQEPIRTVVRVSHKKSVDRLLP
jgi:hypothetical protein